MSKLSNPPIKHCPIVAFCSNYSNGLEFFHFESSDKLEPRNLSDMNIRPANGMRSSCGPAVRETVAAEATGPYTKHQRVVARSPHSRLVSLQSTRVQCGQSRPSRIAPLIASRFFAPDIEMYRIRLNREEEYCALFYKSQSYGNFVSSEWDSAPRRVVVEAFPHSQYASVQFNTFDWPSSSRD